jgi:hypothetical protein
MSIPGGIMRNLSSCLAGEMEHGGWMSRVEEEWKEKWKVEGPGGRCR